MGVFAKIMAVGLGGFLGAVARYLVASLVRERSLHAFFPYSTLVVNVLGCFVIGVLMAIAEERGVLGAQGGQARLFLFTGLLGSFTTFSTFGWDGFELFREGEAGSALLYLFASLGLGLLAVWGGRAGTGALLG